MNSAAVFVGLLLAAPDTLVAEVAAGHRANYERVRTLAAVFTSRPSQDGKPIADVTLRYLRDLNGAVVRDGVEGKSLTEHALLAGEVRRLTRTWPAKPPGAVRVTAARVRAMNATPDYDLWLALGGEFVGGDRRRHDLATVLAESDPPAAAARDTRDGVPLIKVTHRVRSASGSPYRSHQWFDPARGYVPVRSESADGTSVGEWTGLTSYAEGVWLPTRLVSESHLSHGNYRQETVVTDMKVNEPLPAGGTALLLPAGTEVKDELRGTKYKGSPNWSPAGPEERWQPLVVGQPPADAGPFTAPTPAEPVGWNMRLLYAAAGLLGVGLVGLAVRWVLARRAEGRP